MRRLIWMLLSVFLIPMTSIAFAQGIATATHKFMLAGLGQTSFISEEGENSTVETAFEPIFLYSVNDRLLFEGEVEAEIEDGGQAFNLEYAQLLYVVNDYIVIGGGKFLNPSDFFMERLHPAWINKLPDKPFFQHEETKLQAPTHIGFQVRGAIPAGSSKIEYAAYMGNGPIYVPDDMILEFDNFGDNNSDKVVGGRVSFLPVPQVEIGYGVETAKVGDKDSEFSDVRELSNTVDFTYVSKISSLKGGVDIRAQASWLQLQNIPTGNSATVDKTSKGGYAQIAYHPYNAASPVLKNIEIAYRFDWFDPPDDVPMNAKLTRSAFGLSYWLSSSSAIKLAFETTTEDVPGENNATTNRFIGQLAIGF